MKCVIGSCGVLAALVSVFRAFSHSHSPRPRLLRTPPTRGLSFFVYSRILHIYIVNFCTMAQPPSQPHRNFPFLLVSADGVCSTVPSSLEIFGAFLGRFEATQTSLKQSPGSNSMKTLTVWMSLVYCSSLRLTAPRLTTVPAEKT